MSGRRLRGTNRGRPSHLLGVFLFLGAAALACYSGGEREKEPPPGYPGGLCRSEPMTPCEEPALCDLEGGYCYDPDDPCTGVFCGGFGECFIDQSSLLPQCRCDPGYFNERYFLICEPPS
ncbi:MAG: hypothetical protein R3A51_16965 [Nannocystaceae bacterium]